MGSLWGAGDKFSLLALFDLLGAFFSWDEKHEKQLIFYVFWLDSLLPKLVLRAKSSAQNQTKS